jgi:ribosome-binding protein aMBF1 (putative translation factor)
MSKAFFKLYGWIFVRPNHYSTEKSHLYVAESCYKYNNRKNKNTFSEMIKKMLGV